MEENVVKNLAEAATEEGFEVVDLVPTEGTDIKTVAIIGGVSFVAGVIATKVAKPVIRKVKSIWANRKRKVSKDDFQVVEDAEFEDVETKEESAE